MAANAVNKADSFPVHSSSAQIISKKASKSKIRQQEKKGKPKRHKN
jgi:hypothetical protein